ncbi:MAG: hypothetical protein EOP24_16650 [Hyphomicrobiales bacterium]|nr:MAG: hypothetical protein EOP24_16650 [Hyphomicrobiales bacterium]
MGRGEFVFMWPMIAVVTLAAISMFGPSIIAETGSTPTNGLYHYQGLVGGVLTIVAAVLGGAYLNKQMRQDARIEQERIAHDREAERAVLPLTLSAICGYAIASGRLGKSLLDQCVGGRLPDDVVVEPNAIPVLPASIIADLKQMIRALDFDQIPAAAKLLAEIQVHDGRMRDFATRERMLLSVGLHDHILDAAEIYARAEAFFGFARREVDTLPQSVTWGRVSAALFFMDILTGVIPELDDRIAHVSGGNPDAVLNR